MGVPASEVSYTSASNGRGDHEVHKGHVVALEIKNNAAMTSELVYLSVVNNRGQGVGFRKDRGIFYLLLD
jgi:hypothetical protein